MSTISNEAGTREADIREDLDHETSTSDILTAEPVVNGLTDVDRPAGGIDARPDHERRQPSHVFGWVLVAVAVVASIALALLVVADEPSTRVPVPDAKDNPNFGPVVVPPVVGDAKDHPNYGPVATPAAIGDAKDHPNYGPVVVPPVVGDAKDHPNYGPVVTPTAIGDAKDHAGYGLSPATCRSMPEPGSPYCPPED